MFLQIKELAIRQRLSNGNVFPNEGLDLPNAPLTRIGFLQFAESSDPLDCRPYSERQLAFIIPPGKSQIRDFPETIMANESGWR
jgi:hypothetical protein